MALIKFESAVVTVQSQSLNNMHLGCHVVAPSDMNDGRIGVIKQKLSEQSLDTKVKQCSYRLNVLIYYLARLVS